MTLANDQEEGESEMDEDREEEMFGSSKNPTYLLAHDVDLATLRKKLLDKDGYGQYVGMQPYPGYTLFDGTVRIKTQEEWAAAHSECRANWKAYVDAGFTEVRCGSSVPVVHVEAPTAKHYDHIFGVNVHGVVRSLTKGSRLLMYMFHVVIRALIPRLKGQNESH